MHSPALHWGRTWRLVPAWNLDCFFLLFFLIHQVPNHVHLMLTRYCDVVFSWRSEIGECQRWIVRWLLRFDHVCLVEAFCLRYKVHMWQRRIYLRRYLDEMLLLMYLRLRVVKFFPQMLHRSQHRFQLRLFLHRFCHAWMNRSSLCMFTWG